MVNMRSELAAAAPVLSSKQRVPLAMLPEWVSPQASAGITSAPPEKPMHEQPIVISALETEADCDARLIAIACRPSCKNTVANVP